MAKGKDSFLEVAHRKLGLITAFQALSDYLAMTVDASDGCNLVATAVNDVEETIDALEDCKKDLHLDALLSDADRLERDGCRFGVQQAGGIAVFIRLLVAAQEEARA